MKPLLIIILCLAGYGVIGQKQKDIKVNDSGSLLDTASAGRNIAIGESSQLKTTTGTPGIPLGRYIIDSNNITGQDSITFIYDTIPVIILYIDTSTITFHWSTGEVVRDNQIVRWMKGYEVMQLVPAGWEPPDNYHELYRKYVAYLDEKKRLVGNNIIVLLVK